MGKRMYKFIFLLCVALCICCTGCGKKLENKEKMMNKQTEIYLAGGCFWGTEHFLKQVNGVLNTETGYANGFCRGCTGSL